MMPQIYLGTLYASLIICAAALFLGPLG